MRPEANLQRRGGRSSPGFSGQLASPGSLVAPLHRWRGTEETKSDTINPKNYLSVKAGQLQSYHSIRQIRPPPPTAHPTRPPGANSTAHALMSGSTIQLSPMSSV